MPIKIPSVKAPDLTKRSHDINIPAGAFREDVGAATAKIGTKIEQGATSVNLALFREKQRLATTAANEAFRNVPIDQQTKMDAARQVALKNPTTSLPGFQAVETTRFDEDMKKISENMDPGTKRRFDQLTLPVRTRIAISNNKFARTQMIVNGRNAMNASVAALVATASKVDDTTLLKDQVVSVLMNDFSKGYGLDYRLNPKDLDTEIIKAKRQIDRNDSHSMVDKEPAKLKEMLKDPNQLEDLTDADETEFRNRANSSMKNIAQKYEVTAWAENIKIFGDQAMAALTGTANYSELAYMIDATQIELDSLLTGKKIDPNNPTYAKGGAAEIILRKRIDVLRDCLTLENSPDEVKILGAAQKKVIDREATKLADEIQGKPPTISEEEQFFNEAIFIGRFNEYMISKKRRRGANRKGPASRTVAKNASVQLQEIADLQGDLIRAVAEKGVRRVWALTYFEKLMGPMKKMIESKHFQAKDGMWGVGKKDADIYSGPFTHVLSELEKAATGGAEFMNDPIAQNLAITFVFEEAERQDLSDDGIKNDSIKTELAISNISKVALNRTKRVLLNLDSFENIPDGIMKLAENEPSVFKVPTQAVIDVMKANPNNANTKKIFIERYGQDQFDAITGDDAEAYFNLGVTYSDSGKWKEAIDEYKQAIGIDPDYALAHYNLGNAYIDSGKYKEAIESYKQAIRINPDDAHAHINLGFAYDELGEHDEAIKSYKQAIRIYPNDAYAHNNLGYTYDELGEYDEAIKSYKQAIRIDPDYVLAHYNLACSYSSLGNVSKALESLGKAIDSGFDDIKYMENDSDLDGLRDEAGYKKLINKLKS